MKRMLAVLLISFLLFSFACPGLAEGGQAVFSFEGADYHVTYAGSEIEDGKLRIDVSGFGSTLPFRNGQVVVIAWLGVVVDGEELRADNVSMNGDGVYSYFFNVDQLPGAVLLYPYEDDENGILLWEAGDEPSKDEPKFKRSSPTVSIPSALQGGSVPKLAPVSGGAGNEPAGSETPGTEEDEGPFGGVTAGDGILFGRYDQDDNPGNGSEAIEWIALDVADGYATLMSRYVLDARAFNGIGMAVAWDGCSLRKWLNRDFLNAAFSDAEQAALQTVDVTADINPAYPNSNPGADTQDKVYLLSVNEAIEYFGALNIRPARPTETAVAHGVYVSNTSGDEGTTAWWLRSPGGYSDRAAYIVSDNRLIGNGGDVGETDYGVRPVVRVKLSGLNGVARLSAEPTPEPTEAPTPEPTEAPTPEPTEAPTPEPTEAPTPEPTEAPTPEPTEAPTPEPAREVTTDDILDALNNDTYRATYEALLSGEVVRKGTINDTAKGVQQMLIDFGQDIVMDGNVGPKSIAALNAVQAAFGMEQTEELDAEACAKLLPMLLISTDGETARDLLGDSLGGEFDYLRACALAASGNFFSAKQAFEESGYGDWEERAAACVLPWPNTGVLYRSPDVWGSDTELIIKYNSRYDKAILVKIYTRSGVLARTLFIGGTGKASTTLPGGTYVIKDGTGSDWYGDKEAFGDDGNYEIMTFGGGEQEVTLKSGHSYTLTVNVEEIDPSADSVGSDYENWSDF